MQTAFWPPNPRMTPITWRGRAISFWPPPPTPFLSSLLFLPPKPPPPPKKKKQVYYHWEWVTFHSRKQGLALTWSVPLQNICLHLPGTPHSVSEQTPQQQCKVQEDQLPLQRCLWKAQAEWWQLEGTASGWPSGRLVSTWYWQSIGTVMGQNRTRDQWRQNLGNWHKN